MMEKFGKCSASLYDLFLCSGFGPEARFRQRTVELCRAGLGEKILELGCGTARSSETLLRSHPGAFEMTGLDLSRHMLGRAAKNCAGLDINFVIADAGSIPFADHSFDRVVAVLAFHEMPAPVRASALSECSRILRPGGSLVAVEYRRPDNMLLRIVHRSLFFEGPSLQEMLAAGLDNEIKSTGLKIAGCKIFGWGIFEVIIAIK